MGVWIEIEMNVANILEDLSLPLWECGLKSAHALYIPLAVLVTPLVGVWIEIAIKILLSYHKRSLPLWECGLKCLPVPSQR